jgi:hypothetical protein
MKKLIQILIVCGLVVVMGGTASGQTLAEEAVTSAKSTVNCSSEKDSLKRLTCYDNLPENLKNQKCSSISDSLKRLSCFESKKNSKVAEEKANVVIKILDGTPYFRTSESRDEFGDFEGHEIESGCTFLLEIENKTSHQIQVNSYFLASDKTYAWYDNSGMQHGADQNYHNSIPGGGGQMKPNSKFEFTKPVTYLWISKSKDGPNEEEKKKFIKKYGCDSHEGGLYIAPNPGWPTTVKYRSSSGISDPSNKHIIGSSLGAYPLQKKLKMLGS